MNAFLKHLESDDDFLVNGYIRKMSSTPKLLLLAQIKSYTDGYGGEYVNKRKFLKEMNLSELEFNQLTRKLSEHGVSDKIDF